MEAKKQRKEQEKMDKERQKYDNMVNFGFVAAPTGDDDDKKKDGGAFFVPQFDAVKTATEKKQEREH